jgi:hypothetical protein
MVKAKANVEVNCDTVEEVNKAKEILKNAGYEIKNDLINPLKFYASLYQETTVL